MCFAPGHRILVQISLVILRLNINKATDFENSRYLGKEGIWCAEAFCVPITFLQATCGLEEYM